MKEKIQKSVFWGVLLSETSHIFCCVLPTVFSLISLAAGFGMAVSMPPFLERIHENLHAWELPILFFSGFILAAGWGLTTYSARLDCHDTGCTHGPCHPQRKRAYVVLKIASVLFLINIIVFLGVHRTHYVQDILGLSSVVEPVHDAPEGGKHHPEH